MLEIKKFVLNGQNYYTKSNVNLFNLISYFDYNTSLLVVEHNSFIQNKKNWKNILIKTGDQIEIVTIVGGG